jgi:hypothetical protein
MRLIDQSRRRVWRFGLLTATGLLAAGLWWLAPAQVYSVEAALAQADPVEADPAQLSSAPARRAFEAKRSGVWLRAGGEVIRILPDDLDNSRHQRFIIRLPDGQTLLISHNIDLAPRVPLRRGEPVEVRGRYEWNPKGGLIHWTHLDPARKLPGGWIRHRGRTFR